MRQETRDGVLFPKRRDAVLFLGGVATFWLFVLVDQVTFWLTGDDRGSALTRLIPLLLAMVGLATYGFEMLEVDKRLTAERDPPPRSSWAVVRREATEVSRSTLSAAARRLHLPASVAVVVIRALFVAALVAALCAAPLEYFFG